MKNRFILFMLIGLLLLTLCACGVEEPEEEPYMETQKVVEEPTSNLLDYLPYDESLRDFVANFWAMETYDETDPAQLVNRAVTFQTQYRVDDIFRGVPVDEEIVRPWLQKYYNVSDETYTALLAVETELYNSRGDHLAGGYSNGQFYGQVVGWGTFDGKVVGIADASVEGNLYQVTFYGFSGANMSEYFSNIKDSAVWCEMSEEALQDLLIEAEVADSRFDGKLYHYHAVLEPKEIDGTDNVWTLHSLQTELMK